MMRSNAERSTTRSLTTGNARARHGSKITASPSLKNRMCSWHTVVWRRGPCDDAARLAVDDDDVEHLAARMHGDRPGGDLALQRLVGAEQQLLSRLTASVECPLHLDAAEGACLEQAAVVTRERNALGGALIDDVDADLG